MHDVSSIYRVPLLLESQGVVSYLSRRLNMPIETRPRKMLTKWKEMSDRWVLAPPPADGCHVVSKARTSRQVGQAVGAVLHRAGGEVHQVLRLLRLRHQGPGALGPRHQPQAGGQGRCPRVLDSSQTGSDCHTTRRHNHITPPQYIDSACLEPSSLQEDPVKYHEAWQKLCGSG